MPNSTQVAPRPFFTLNGKYQIAQDTDSVHLLDDTVCLLESALGVLYKAIDTEDSCPELFACSYLLEMAKADVTAPTLKLPDMKRLEKNS